MAAEANMHDIKFRKIKVNLLLLCFGEKGHLQPKDRPVCRRCDSGDQTKLGPHLKSNPDRSYYRKVRFPIF